MPTELRVERMHCAGCVGSVQRGLWRILGVKEVQVDTNRKRITAEHDETVEVSAIVLLLNEMGFEARLPGTSA